MATTGSKRGSTPRSTPVPRSSSATPSQQRPKSPLSPTRATRLQEKAELQHLNDRLAAYIDRVRNLETENSRLTIEIQKSQEIVTKEVTNIKSMYENELSDARKMIDETAKEKAKLEIDLKRLWEDNDDLKTRLNKESKDLTLAQTNVRLLEQRVAKLSNDYNTASGDLRKALDELKELKNQNDALRKQVDETRRALEDETLSRVDLENTVQSLREELTFKDQIHAQELNETRTRRQVEISEIDGRLSQQYEAKLQQSLQDLRDQYEAQMRANRSEIEALYEKKIESLQNAAKRNNSMVASTNEELRVTRSKIDGLNLRISDLELQNAALQARAKDLEKMLDLERARHADDIAALENELSRLRREMEQQFKEYQDLMDIKVSLDLEIAAYDKLLSGEESRLNLDSSTGSRGRPGKKRKRLIEESEEESFTDYYINSTAKGDIEIAEIDPEGRFVKLHNKSNKEISIGGWQLVRQAGNNETNFKFHRSVKIDANSYVTVWSSDTGASHEPPSNIVMKQQKWFMADNTRTILLNNDGDEVASLDRIKQQESSMASRQSHNSSSIFRRYLPF